ncbi:hypothetical protein DVS28_b0118 (plasmid) [Euzebya pacifica]|uniref:Uncharacterized protein n=1 Tax=Euzebya pacifica TaxID=1608957 RepID=A0A346Y5Z1_9ACTN|nr:hypothetical protein [Euzebya pacifica]AXV09888.1 hypothetical protein DVS28_b0118 [Euzebya pacifica]
MTTTRTCGHQTRTGPCNNPAGKGPRCAAGHKVATTAQHSRQAAAHPTVGLADPFAAPVTDPTHPAYQHAAHARDRLQDVMDADGYATGTAAELDAAAQWALPRVDDAIAHLDGHLAAPTLTALREADSNNRASFHIAAAHAQLGRLHTGGTTPRVRSALAAIRDRLLAARIDVLAHAVAARATGEDGNGFEQPWNDAQEQHDELSAHLGRAALDHEVGWFHDRTFDAIDAIKAHHRRHDPIKAAHPDLTDTQVAVYAELQAHPDSYAPTWTPEGPGDPMHVEEVLARWNVNGHRIRTADGTLITATANDVRTAWTKAPVR